MPRGQYNRQPIHDTPKNQSDAVNPEEFDVKLAVPPHEASKMADNPHYQIPDQKLVHPDFEKVAILDANRKAHIAGLLFDKELVTVDILDTDDENADIHFCIEVSGEKQLFTRGKRITVMRKFVEGLARAKPISYANPLKNHDGEITAQGYRGRKGEKYPFQVYHDPNPIGAEWLRRVRSQS